LTYGSPFPRITIPTVMVRVEKTGNNPPQLTNDDEFESHMDAGKAAEFRAVGTESSISQLFHADETSEHFGQCLCNTVTMLRSAIMTLTLL